MNTMTELLLPELADLRIAERHAEATEWRRAREATEASRPHRTWNLAALLRPTGLRGGRAARAV